MVKSNSEKLDEVLKAIKELASRMDTMEKNFEKFDNRLNTLEKNFNDRLDHLESSLTKKAETSEIEKLKKRMSAMENSFETKLELVEKFNGDFDDIFDRVIYLEEAETERQSQALMQESYDKRFNILFHGLEESNTNAWETREETQKILYKFLQNGLKIQNPSTIVMADFHRLPQQPIYKQRTKINRPVIVKLTNAADKHRIFSCLKHLKSHNDNRRLVNLGPQYITEHLPKKFQEEKKLLLPHFKEARKLKKKTYWKAEKGHYALYIDNIKVDLE